MQASAEERRQPLLTRIGEGKDDTQDADAAATAGAKAVSDADGDAETFAVPPLGIMAEGRPPLATPFIKTEPKKEFRWFCMLRPEAKPAAEGAPQYGARNFQDGVENLQAVSRVQMMLIHWGARNW